MLCNYSHEILWNLSCKILPLFEEKRFYDRETIAALYLEIHYSWNHEIFLPGFSIKS